MEFWCRGLSGSDCLLAFGDIGVNWGKVGVHHRCFFTLLSVGTRSILILYQYSCIPTSPDVRDAVLVRI